MFKKLSFLVCAMLLLTGTAFASVWQPIHQDADTHTSIDLESIRYGSRDGKPDRNQITCYTKTIAANGYTIFSYTRIHRAEQTYEPLKNIGMNKDKSSISQTSSSGFSFPIKNDPAIKAVYDFLIPYCQKNDAAIVAHGGTPPVVDGLELPSSSEAAPAAEADSPDIQAETV